MGIFQVGIFPGGIFLEPFFWGFFQTKITVSFKKTTLQKNFFIVEEELDGTEAGNLEDSPRFAFIDEECENLIIVNVEKVLEIKTERRSQAFHNSL